MHLDRNLTVKKKCCSVKFINFENNSLHDFPSLNTKNLPRNGSVLMVHRVGQCAACHNKPGPHQAAETWGDGGGG